MSPLKELQIEAEHLAGRPLEVEKTADGQWIVLYMSFDVGTPPKGDDPKEAWEKFLVWIKGVKPSAPEAISDLPLDDTGGKLNVQ